MTAVAAVPVRALLRTASLGLAIAGFALAAQGAWVPIEAEMAQVELDQVFEQSLAGNVIAAATSAPSDTERFEAPGKRAATPIPVARMPLTPAAAAVDPALTVIESPTIAPGKPLARIAVKRLGVRDVILAGQPTHDELARGPMMVKRGDASSPVTVLAAHRDTHFLFIRDLREGDIVTMQYVTGQTERYRVTFFETVRWNEFAYPIDPARPLLALTTCYPFGGTEYGGPWRRVAWAEKIG